MGKDINDYYKCKVCLSATDSHKKAMRLYFPTVVSLRSIWILFLVWVHFACNLNFFDSDINQIQNDWIGYLKSVQFCINNTTSESTAFSFSDTHCGSNPRSPISIVLQYNDNDNSKILSLDKKS
ncbi:hypothetical protein ACTA71_000251 [Dictyostelium dimigraforme]